MPRRFLSLDTLRSCSACDPAAPAILQRLRSCKRAHASRRARFLWPDIGRSNAFYWHVLALAYTYSPCAFIEPYRYLVAPYTCKRAHSGYPTRKARRKNGACTALGSMRRRGIAKKRPMIQKRPADRRRKNFRAGFFSWKAPIAYRESRKSYGSAKVVSYSAR